MSLFFFGPIIIAIVYICLPCCGLLVIRADVVQKIHVQILTDLSICICLFCCGLVAFMSVLPWSSGIYVCFAVV